MLNIGTTQKILREKDTKPVPFACVLVLRARSQSSWLLHIF